MSCFSSLFLITSAASIVSIRHTSCSTRFTRGRVRELKNAHKSVTVQNRTHVYMKFFDHKNPRNHLLQLCPKVVKHPVYHRLKQKFCVLPTKCMYVFHMILSYDHILQVNVRPLQKKLPTMPDINSCYNSLFKAQ